MYLFRKRNLYPAAPRLLFSIWSDNYAFFSVCSLRSLQLLQLRQEAYALGMVSNLERAKHPNSSAPAHLCVRYTRSTHTGAPRTPRTNVILNARKVINRHKRQPLVVAEVGAAPLPVPKTKRKVAPAKATTPPGAAASASAADDPPLSRRTPLDVDEDAADAIFTADEEAVDPQFVCFRTLPTDTLQYAVILYSERKKDEDIAVVRMDRFGKLLCFTGNGECLTQSCKHRKHFLDALPLHHASLSGVAISSHSSGWRVEQTTRERVEHGPHFITVCTENHVALLARTRSGTTVCKTCKGSHCSHVRDEKACNSASACVSIQNDKAQANASPPLSFKPGGPSNDELGEWISGLQGTLSRFAPALFPYTQAAKPQTLSTGDQFAVSTWMNYNREHQRAFPVAATHFLCDCTDCTRTADATAASTPPASAHPASAVAVRVEEVTVYVMSHVGGAVLIVPVCSKCKAVLGINAQTSADKALDIYVGPLKNGTAFAMCLSTVRAYVIDLTKSGRSVASLHCQFESFLDSRVTVPSLAAGAQSTVITLAALLRQLCGMTQKPKDWAPSYVKAQKQSTLSTSKRFLPIK